MCLREAQCCSCWHCRFTERSWGRSPVQGAFLVSIFYPAKNWLFVQVVPYLYPVAAWDKPL